eukprot:9471130-Pyramimonas_sp.AAC.1
MRHLSSRGVVIILCVGIWTYSAAGQLEDFAKDRTLDQALDILRATKSSGTDIGDSPTVQELDVHQQRLEEGRPPGTPVGRGGREGVNTVNHKKLGLGLSFLTRQIKAAKLYFQLTGKWDQTLDTMASHGEVFMGCSKDEFGYQGCPSTDKIAHFLFEKWIPPRTPVTKAEEGLVAGADWIFKGHFFYPRNLAERR